MPDDNWGIIGHGKIIKFLNKSIEAEKLAHAYLFYGQSSLGKSTMANKLAEKLLNSARAQVTDLYKIEPLEGKKHIAIDQVREWRQRLQMKSFHNGYKVGIIFEAEKLNPESANALLKTIEEPTPRTIIILVSSAWDRILPTIVSRSQQIRFSPVPRQEIIKSLISDYPASEVEEMVNFIGGYPGRVIDYLKNPEVFAEYQKLHKLIIGVFNSNLAEKFLVIEKLLASVKEFNKKVVLAVAFLNQFKVIFRELLLENYQLAGLRQVKNLKIEKRYTTQQILQIGQKIDEAELQLYGNAQPRLILENLLLNI